jgi:hypothetical protein
MDKLQPRSQARRRLITAAAASAALNAVVPADPAAASAGAARWSTTAAPQALVLSGRVVDAGGRPLAAARITVRSALPASAAGAWPEALNATSDGDGRFLIVGAVGGYAPGQSSQSLYCCVATAGHATPWTPLALAALPSGTVTGSDGGTPIRAAVALVADVPARR